MLQTYVMLRSLDTIYEQTSKKTLYTSIATKSHVLSTFPESTALMSSEVEPQREDNATLPV